MKGVLQSVQKFDAVKMFVFAISEGTVGWSVSLMLLESSSWAEYEYVKYFNNTLLSFKMDEKYALSSQGPAVR